MGHSSTRAALIYQHSTDARQRASAQKLNDVARGVLGEIIGHTTGTKPRTALQKSKAQAVDLGFRMGGA
ncbi:hypothetical protein Pka01_42030 [Planotetraspora kaengkrachanensis]|uniref:Uncharacterized protein n=1 Tax=Planotetraspora kaengkrachanensis TaxID=575193 RepID=A0A8J3PU38_9ACTN|nr:hypothetical protein Pka01_42030 [Planotetraspora kaengkrachanensis]